MSGREALLEEADRAARLASIGPWRADGRRVLDASGALVAETHGEEVQARRDAVAIAASLNAALELFDGYEDKQALLASKSALEADVEELRSDVRYEREMLREAKRTREKAEEELRAIERKLEAAKAALA